MFSEILRQLRLEQKLTQSDMAKALSISRVTYTNYELGNREPDFDTITRIARIFGTTVDYLLGNSAARGTRPDALPAQEPPAGGLPKSLRLIMISAAGLSSESYADLQKYIELLKIKEKSANRPAHGRYAASGRGTQHKNNQSGVAQ